MGLKSVFVTVLILISGCTPRNIVAPSDRNLHGQKFFYDCCDPSILEGTQQLCDDAAKDEDHILWDTDRNRYIYVWSDCLPGEEPWRNYGKSR